MHWIFKTLFEKPWICLVIVRKDVLTYCCNSYKGSEMINYLRRYTIFRAKTWARKCWSAFLLLAYFPTLTVLEFPTITLTQENFWTTCFFLNLADKSNKRSIVAESKKDKNQAITSNLVNAQIQISGRHMWFERRHNYKP